MSNDIKDAVERVIRRVAEERGLALPALRDDTEIVDELGFSSLVVAALIASLEEGAGLRPVPGRGRDDHRRAHVR